MPQISPPILDEGSSISPLIMAPVTSALGPITTVIYSTLLRNAALHRSIDLLALKNMRILALFTEAQPLVTGTSNAELIPRITRGLLTSSREEVRHANFVCRGWI